MTGLSKLLVAIGSSMFAVTIAHAQLSNGGFETGTFPPWTITDANGNAVSGTFGGQAPAEGNFQAVITTPNPGTVSRTSLETFLELNSGTLASLNPGSLPGGGSAFTQTFTVQDGQVISFLWDFLPNGSSGGSQNDTGFFVLHPAGSPSSSFTVLATTTSSGGSATGYQRLETPQLSAGSYLLGFAAYDAVGDSGSPNAQNPALLIDNVQQISCTPPPPNMVGWWPGDTNAYDIQGNYNGTLQGNTAFVTGKVLQAFTFDGTGDYVETGDLDLPATFTIDAWVNPASLASDSTVVSKGVNGSPADHRSYLFQVLSNGRVQLLVQGSGTNITLYSGDAQVTTGLWQHIAVTYDGNAAAGSKVQAFKNGSAVSMLDAFDDATVPFNNDVNMTIGAASGGLAPFTGQIDEVEIFDRVLSVGEIQAIYNAGGAGKCKPPIHFANISARAAVGTGENVEIGGFIIHSDSASTRRTSGPGATKRVLIRGLGPSLQVNNIPVPGRLEDTFLELHDQNGVLITSNDDWGSAPNAAAIQNTGLAPSDPKESAILQDLNLDQGYTAILSGKDPNTGDPASGIGLVEVYDLQGGDGISRLANVSARGNVLTGDDVLIGGVIVRGNQTLQIVFRGIGPSMSTQGVANPLLDPTLELHDGNGTLLQSNDDWGSSPDAGAINTLGLAPTNAKESAILYTPVPGAYTAIVSGVGGTTGVGLVEAYDIGPPP